MANTPTAGDDNITGAAGRDTIDGLAGADTIDGAGGNDILKGNDGNDFLTGGAGNDNLYGQNGVDTAVYHNTVVQAASAGAPVIGSWVGALLTLTTGGVDGTDVLNTIEKLLIDGVTFDVNLATRNVVAQLGADVAGGDEDDGPILGNVLANDFDVDSALTVTGVSFGANVGSVGSGLQGAHGTLTLNANGTYSYAPAAEASGTDVFTYQVLDGGVARSVTLTINVAPVNDAPVAHDGANSGDEDTVIAGSVSATDPDSAVTYTVGTGPAHGIVTVNPDGTYEYTPNANYHGADSFTFVASDGSLTDSGQVDLTINSVPGDTLIVGPGGYATIQEAIDAAEAGDTIQITAGTYAENVLVNKSGISIVGVGEVNLVGTFKSDNGIVGDVNSWLETATSYDNASGIAFTVSGDNVSISNINIDSYYTGIETTGDITGLALTDVDVSNGIFGLHKELDNGSIDGLTVTGGSFSHLHIGIDFEKNPALTGNDVVNFTLDGTSFSDITAKGFYAETLTDGHLTNFTMTNVGYFGGTPSFGGFAGSGIELNLKMGAFSGIEIDHFTMTNVGQSTRFGPSHDNAAAISIKPRDDSGSYTPVSITDVIRIHDGTIDGTSTGIRNGESGRVNQTGDIEIENVVITGAVHDAQNGDIESRSNADTHVIGSDQADSWVVSPQSVGTISFDLGDGADTVDGGTSTGALTLDGGDGNDSLTGGAGNDTFVGGAGDDTFVGGGGIDTASYDVELTAADFDGSSGAFTLAVDGADSLGVERVVDASGDVFWLVPAGGSIQAAVNAAADGDTILIASGTYREQVVIDNRDLTIIASDGATLEAPDHAAMTSAGAYSVLAIVNGSNVTVENLDIDGRHQGGDPVNGYFTDQQFGGVAFINSDGAFRGGAISGMTNDVLGPYQYGYGVIARSTGAEHHVEISDTVIDDYQKNGIDARGAGLVVDLHGNSVTGQGATSVIGQNGIVLVGGVEGTIDDNTISGIGWIPGNYTAVGVLIHSNGDAPVVVTDNTITMAGTGSDSGINLVSSEGVTITGNTISNADVGVSQNSDIVNPLDGTALDANTYVNVTTQYEFDSDDGLTDAFTVTGTAGDDYLDGSASGDTLTGGDGDDTLSGMDGDDTLVGGGGDDAFVGGDGIDTAQYDVELTTADFNASGGAFSLAVDGTDSLGVERVVDASGDVFWLVPAGGSIQDAIDNAASGDTILIAEGTYAENVLVNKSGISIVGVGEVNLVGTFKSDNGIVGDVNSWLETATSYDNASGIAFTVSGDNVSISNINIDSYYTGIETTGDITGLALTDVDVSNGIFGLHKELDNGSIDGLTVTGGSFSHLHIGIDFEKNPALTGNDVVNFTLDGTSFSDITAKGFYAETLTDGHLTNFTMTNVGYFGGTPSFGGFAGSGIELNLKMGAFSGIEIDHFTMTNVGQSTRFGPSHDNAAAISIKPRDDSGSYTPVSITDVIRIHDGTIDGTSTGIRNGESGRVNQTGDIEIENVVITGAVHDAQNGDIESRSNADTHVIGSDQADSWVVSPQSVGTISFDLGDGADTVDGGTSTGALTLDGGDGNDSLTGGAGNDTFVGGAGDDTFVGGGGIDTASYDVELTAADFDGSSGAFTLAVDGADSLGVERVVDASGDVFWLVPAGGSIQAAVNAAADGDTILIASGTYREQVVIDNRDLTIIASDGATLEAPDHAAMTSAGAYSVLAIVNGSNVTVENLDIDGRHQGGDPVNGYFTDQQFGGVAFINSDGAFRGGAISGMTNDVLGPYQYGYGVIARSTGAEHHVEISDTVIDDYQKNGIDARGAGLVVDLHGNSVTGQGATSVIGQNGIVLVGGVEGTIDDNTISGIGWIPGNYTAVGVLIHSNGDAPVVVTDNTITMAGTGSDSGINLVSSEGVTITGNTISNADVGVSQNSDIVNPLDGTALDANTYVNVTTQYEFDSDDGLTDAFTVTGTAGDDYLDGSASGDTLTGGDGDDTLSGMDGDDTLVGGGGDDAFVGGDGIDTAQYDVELTTADFNASGGAFSLAVDGTDSLGVERVVDASGDVFWLVPAGGSIQDAIDNAASGDTILIAEGTYAENLLVDGKPLSFVGVGDVTITAAGLGSTILVDGDFGGGDLSFSNLTITGSNNGIITAGIYVSGVDLANVTVDDCVFEDNDYAGFYIYESQIDQLTITNSTFQENGEIGLNSGGHIKLVGLQGDALLQNLTLLGQSGGPDAPNSADRPDYGIEIHGTENIVLATEDTVPIGNVVIDNVVISGDFHKSAFAINNYQNLDGLTVTDLDLSGATADWAGSTTSVLNVDGIRDSYDASAWDVSLPGQSRATSLRGEHNTESPSAQTITGTASADQIWGNGGDDRIVGGAGDDLIDGQAGTDTVVLSGLSTAATAVQAGALLTVTTADGVDALTGVEAVEFSDRTITVHDGNAVLVDGDDVASVDEGEAVNGNVLADVFDLDADTITVTALLDQNDDPVTANGSGKFVVQGDHGFLSLNSDGSYSYTATDSSLSAGQIVTEVFTYTASDGADEVSRTLTVSVTGKSNPIVGTNGANTLSGGDYDDVIFGLGGADILSGLAGNDALYGGSGNDQLNGGAGADEMAGEGGNDSYWVDDAGDTVIEEDGGGIDTVTSSISFVLGNFVENLSLSGSANLNGTGNSLGNTLNGNSGANILSGGAGNDIIRGGDGADVVHGGTGNDQVYGQGGADRFTFGNESVVTSGTREADLVRDFNQGEGDILDLSAIDADVNTAGDQAFTLVAGFTHVAGQAVMILAGGATQLRMDVNGDGVEDYRVTLTGDHSGSTILTGGEPEGTGGWLL